jgi:hypothetical protein
MQHNVLACAAAAVCLTLIVPALLGGCARFPEDRDDGGRGKQLVVTLRVRGQIQPPDAQTPYYYFVLINRTDNLNDAGPAPVVERPWGNGFAAPAQPGAQGFDAFVRYDRFQPQGGYGVYRVEGNPVNAVFLPLGRPDAYTTPQRGEATLSFRLDLSRLPDPNARYIQLNLLATNNLPQGADDAPKAWDALGDGRDTGTINTWITIPTDQNSVRTNRDTNLEPAGDVREKLGPTVDEPNLDIVDWTVEIRD